MRLSEKFAIQDKTSLFQQDPGPGTRIFCLYNIIMQNRLLQLLTHASIKKNLQLNLDAHTALLTKMVSTINSYYYSFNAAIALNNIGVSLLERRMYSDALEIFHNSLKLFQSLTAVHKVTTPENSSSLSSTNALDAYLPASDILTEGYVKLARSTTSTNIGSSNKDYDDMASVMCDMNLNVISVVGSAILDNTSLVNAAAISPRRSLLVAIRLEQDLDLDTTTATPIAKLDPRTRLESAIVLCNIGTLYRSYSESMAVISTKNPKKNTHRVQKNLHQKSYKAFKEAKLNTLNLMTNDTDTNSDTDTDSDLTMTLQQGSLLLLILKNRIYLTSDLGNVTASRKLYCQYCTLSYVPTRKQSIVIIIYSSSSCRSSLNSPHDKLFTHEERFKAEFLTKACPPTISFSFGFLFRYSQSIFDINRHQ
jgi:hypothetical protein